MQVALSHFLSIHVDGMWFAILARQQLKAEFFCRPDGTIIPKAPPVPAILAAQIYARDRFLCQECRVKVRRGGLYDTPFDRHPPSGSIDHIFPRSRGGQNIPANLRTLCRSCNCSKGAA
jgi:hypothetical protein